MNTPRFQTLFYLANKNINIIEIKRLDLPLTATKSEIFHWLLINQNQSLQKLTFIAMGKENGFQSREFKEGKLRFNEDLGFYNDQALNGTETSHPLKRHQPYDVPNRLASLVESYITANSLHNITG